MREPVPRPWQPEPRLRAAGAGAAAAGASAAGGGAAGAAAGLCWLGVARWPPPSTKASTSSRVTRPPAPLPLQLGDVDVVLADQAAHGRRHPDVPSPAAGAGSCRPAPAASAAGGARRGSPARRARAARRRLLGAGRARRGLAARPLGAVRLWRGRRPRPARRGSARPRLRPSGSAAAAPCAIARDLGQRRADLHRLAVGHDDLGDGAGDLGGHLGVDLVGHHLEQRVVLLDRVAFLDQPALDRPLGDRLAELRHLDGGQFVPRSRLRAGWHAVRRHGALTVQIAQGADLAPMVEVVVDHCPQDLPGWPLLAPVGHARALQIGVGSGPPSAPSAAAGRVELGDRIGRGVGRIDLRPRQLGRAECVLVVHHLALGDVDEPPGDGGERRRVGIRLRVVRRTSGRPAAGAPSSNRAPAPTRTPRRSARRRVRGRAVGLVQLVGQQRVGVGIGSVRGQRRAPPRRSWRDRA